MGENELPRSQPSQRALRGGKVNFKRNPRSCGFDDTWEGGAWRGEGCHSDPASESCGWGGEAGRLTVGPYVIRIDENGWGAGGGVSPIFRPAGCRSILRSKLAGDRGDTHSPGIGRSVWSHRKQYRTVYLLRARRSLALCLVPPAAKAGKRSGKLRAEYPSRRGCQQPTILRALVVQDEPDLRPRASCAQQWWRS